MKFSSFLFSMGVLLAAGGPAINGVWTLDSAQSTGEAPAWSSMSISDDSRWVRMSQISKDGRATRDVQSECRTDGRFHPVEGGQGGSISCKWDRGTLILEQHWENDSRRRTVRTTLSPDGKLVQDVLSSGPGGTKESRIVWNR